MHLTVGAGVEATHHELGVARHGLLLPLIAWACRAACAAIKVCNTEKSIFEVVFCAKFVALIRIVEPRTRFLKGSREGLLSIIRHCIYHEIHINRARVAFCTW